MCPLVREDSPVLRGMWIHRNFIRPQMELGEDPGEAAGIKVEGENKWLTLIQNAKVNKCPLKREPNESAATGSQMSAPSS